MASDINSITLVGRLTADPEAKAAGNTTVTRLRVAFSTSRKRGDEWEDVPGFVDVVTFGRTADALAGLLERGDQIAVSGRLSWREWEANDGSKRQAHEVVADRVQLTAKPRAKQEAQAVAPAPVQPVPVETDDIPF